MSSADDVTVEEQLPGLPGLPAELLDAVLRKLDASSRLPVFRTSKLLATALLRVCPSIQLTYPTQHDIIGQHLRELPPFLIEVLRNRLHPKLRLTLQPDELLRVAIKQRQIAEPAAAASDASRLGAWMLGAVPLCKAVDCLTISWQWDLQLPWEPAFSTALATSFASLTSLRFKDIAISINHLATAISHPLLLHLDLTSAEILLEGNLGRSPFIGSRLETLSLHLGGYDEDLLSGLLHLPPTLTQLTVTGCTDLEQDIWVRLAVVVRSLTQLQELRLLDEDRDCNVARMPGPMALLQALAHLPSLHTLVLEEIVKGQEQLTALLALTQITSLEVFRFSGLTSSRASAACSWRKLKIWRLDWVTAAHLPLHSLTHPLQLEQLVKGIEEPSAEVLAAAELNLCERNKAGLVLDWGMYLSKATVDLLTEQYLSHSRRTAQQPLHPTVASSSSHSGPSTSLASSSSPEGHITPGGPGSSTRQGEQQGGPAAGGRALMQRLGRCVEVLHITVPGLGEARLSSANREAFHALFPTADIVFGVYYIDD